MAKRDRSDCRRLRRLMVAACAVATIAGACGDDGGTATAPQAGATTVPASLNEAPGGGGTNAGGGSGPSANAGTATTATPAAAGGGGTPAGPGPSTTGGPGASTTAGAAATTTPAPPVTNSATGADVQRVEVSVVHGDVAGGVRRVKVALRRQIALVITADAADTVHVHGYDIERPLEPGAATTITFTADIPGVFEAELHGSGKTLVELEVR